MTKIIENEEYLSHLLRELVETTGEVEKAIELLVADQGIPKRIAESLACGLNIFPKRYELNAGTLGPEGQKRLLLSKVMVVGLGGLGGHVVEQLVRCGLGMLNGVDADWYGQVAVVWPGSKLLSNIYGTKQEGIEKDLGNPPFTPAFIATLMVTEGIKLLLGKKQRENTLLFADLLNSQWQYLTL